MVLFDNIVVGQNVEVLWKGEIRRAKVRYRGRLNGEIGNWVGLELLDGFLNGYSDGRLAGRTYFFCEKDRGIFTTSNMIRFMRTERKLFDHYQSIGDTEVDETLFSKKRSYSQPLHTAHSEKDSSSQSDVRKADETVVKYRQPEGDPSKSVVTRDYCEKLFRSTLGRSRTSKSVHFSNFCERKVGSAPLRKYIAERKAEAEEVQSKHSAYDALRARERQHFITPASISQSYQPFVLQRRAIDQHKRSAFNCRNGYHTPSVRHTYDFEDYSH